MARTRAQDFENKQRVILESAAAVFASQGMEKASMAQVAAHASVSKALLYHYYPSKDALIFAIIIVHLQELYQAIEAADDRALSPRSRLRRLIGAVLENYRDADNEHKVQLNARAALSGPQREEIAALERRIVRYFSAVISAINPELETGARALLTPTTMSLFGMMNWAYMWFRDGGRMARQDYADLLTTLLLDGIGAVR